MPKATLGHFFLGLMIMPFLVGFDFPDSTGTYVKASGGGGHYRFTPACSRATYGTGYREVEVSVQKRIALRPQDPSSHPRFNAKPAHLSFSADIGYLEKRTSVVDIEGTPDSTGWEAASTGWAGRVKTGIDWKWIGIELGGLYLNYGDGDSIGIWNDIGDPKPLPVAGLRLGDLERFYASCGFAGASPLVSGGAFIEAGAGAKLASTRVWAGYGNYPYHEGVALLKISPSWDPVVFHFAGQFNPGQMEESGDYGFSLGIAYRLPGNR